MGLQDVDGLNQSHPEGGGSWAIASHWLLEAVVVAIWPPGPTFAPERIFWVLEHTEENAHLFNLDQLFHK